MAIGGDTVWAYEIQSPLGAGGMGEVYSARDTRLGRDVAIKVLPDHTVGIRRCAQRFEREARAISQLVHRTSARSTTSGARNGHRRTSSWSTSRARRWRRASAGALPLEQTLAVSRIEIADALDKAHRAGHRPPGSQAGQHHADEVGRQAARLRSREGDGAGGARSA